MPAPERLQVGAVGERDLDLHEHVAGAGLRLRHLLDPKVTGRVQPRRLHGVKTTLSASPRRYSSTPSTKRSSGSVVTGGRRSDGSSAIAARKESGVAEREPRSESSFR